MRITLQPAFLIHRMPYRDSSRICDFFTLDHGRVSAIAKSVWRKERGGSFGNLIHPFVPLLISCSGRTELKTLTKVELSGASIEIKGSLVFSGLYLNELVFKFLERYDPHPKLFGHYAKILAQLPNMQSVEIYLREFELFLLRELGYGIDLERDSCGIPIDHGSSYEYDPGKGFTRIKSDCNRNDIIFLGKDILTMAKGEFDRARVSSKRLLRQAIAHHLGDRPIHSRSLFIS